MPSTLDLDPRVDPLIGQTLGGKYTIDRLIGRGGMGHVYSATVTEANGEVAKRDVVIKLIAPPLAQQPQAMARFEREAKRLDGLRHSNIVEMYDYGREDGRAYIVMEWVDGELLSDYLTRKQALSLGDFVPIAAQILKGVGHAHSRDLMIRDIKPANVMLCERKGRANFVKIIDFGLAKMLEGDEDITKQHFIGTSGYLSPEQIKGIEIDLRVDVYALGVLFYQMLSGHMPFEAENDTTLLYKHVHDFPTPLSEVLPEGHEVPEDLVHLIHDCLEKDPNDRPRDANEIVEKLIDCVPMSMFKLPPATPAAAEQTAISALSTAALNAPTGETAAYLRIDEAAPGDSRASGTGRTASGLGPTGQHPIASPTVVEQPAKGGNKLGLIVAGIGAVALLAIGGVVLLGGESAAPEADKAAASAPTEDSAPDLGAAVDEAETLVGEGDFDGADTKLAAIRGQVGSDPSLSGRVERLDEQIEIGRLLAAAKQLDDKGMSAAALEAYQDVLKADASNVVARERIAALEAAIAAEKPSDTPDGGKSSSKKPAATKKPASTTKPEPPKPEPPKPEPPKPEPKPEKNNPFLPTKKKTDNGPFLPTEK